MPFTCPDLAILLTMVIRADAALFGPPPSQLLDPVPASDLVRASVDGLPGLVDDLNSDTTNVLLTLARAWRTCANGDLVRKDAAAEWAMTRSEPNVADALVRARSAYLGAEQPDWPTRAPSVQFADRLVAHIKQTAGVE
jgi:streptomycin 3"-adenylyltransferase